MNKTRQTAQGFTIVELLIVIVVIAILAAITIVAYNGIQSRSRESASFSNTQQAGKKITVYALSNSEVLPVSAAAAGLNDAGGITYQYTPNTTVTPNTFCLTTTSNGVSSHVAGTTSSVKSVVAGPCAGHSGTSPTTLADGSGCPTGYIVVPGSSLYDTKAFCVMKYEAKNVSSVATSQAAGTPWVSLSQTTAISTAAASCSGCHLITEAEWLTIAQNTMSLGANWTSGTVGSGSMYRGHSDSAPANSLAAAADSDPFNGTGESGTSSQRRTLTLTNGEVIWDFTGNVYEWTDATTTGNQPGANGGNWRDWNALSVPGSITPNPYPTYGNPSAAVWVSTQNIGRLFSDSSDTTQRAFQRGGYWANGTNAGVYTLLLNVSPSNTASSIGFRAAL